LFEGRAGPGRAGPAGGGDNLVGMAMDFDWRLGASEDADDDPAYGRTWMFSAMKAPIG
jgi:hypothetical protein